MGITLKYIKVKPRHSSEKEVSVECMIDSRAVYSLVPGSILNGLGIKPNKGVEFSLLTVQKFQERFGMHISGTMAKVALRGYFMRGRR